MLPELEEIAALVRAPHGYGTIDLCAVGQVVIAAPGGSSSDDVIVPFNGCVSGVPGGLALQHVVFLTVKADRGLDCRIRFQSGGPGTTLPATINDWLIAAGDQLQVVCFDECDTSFRIYGNVVVGGDAIASYYVSGINR